MNAQINRAPRERLIEVAEWLEAHTPVKAGVNEFDMRHWVEKNDCGTSCCLAGAIVQFDQAAKGCATLIAGDVSEINADVASQYCDLGDYAADLCALNPAEAQELFRENMDATPADAAATIRRFLITGQLYWDDDMNGEESSAITQSRQLPTKNSVLLGADGMPLPDGDTNVVAVLNTVTGVVRAWKPFGNKSFPHEQAIKVAESLPQLPGHTPWDLSSKEDMEAILASSESDVFDVEQYPDILDRWYWAKDLHKSSSGYAWIVDFYSGFVNYVNRGARYRALAVCRPVPASQ